MAEFCEMKVLDLWYSAVEAEMLVASVRDAALRRRAIKNLARARESSTSEGIFPKLVDDSGGVADVQRPVPLDLPLERSRRRGNPSGSPADFRTIPRIPDAPPTQFARSL